MLKFRWRPFPYADAAYDYAGGELKKHWARLHQGDCELYPDVAGLKRLIAAHPALEPTMALQSAATALQDAWRAYHRGDFGQAIEQGLAVGLIGANVANKSANIYATYLEPSSRGKLDIFRESADRAETLQARAKTLANAWYFHAQALGRYSQEVSVLKALADGLGNKVRTSLERAIALQPRHADAHIGLGAYNAEVINKVGALVGGLTYGASKDAAVRHFDAALKLNPHSAIARIEYANGLVMMFGKSEMKRATGLYEEAAASTPMDAMERLDVELAKSELAE